jgi:hypothetical protein
MAYDGKRIVPTANSEDKFLNSGIVPEQAFRWKIEAALTILLTIARDFYQYSFGVVEQRVAPVEFWFSCLLVYKRMTVLSTVRLATEIGEMRRYIRGKWVDIRANTNIHKDLYEFLDKTVPNKRINGEKAAIEEDPELTANMSRKRRREEEQDGTYIDNAPSGRHARTSDVVHGLRSNQYY